MCVRAATPVDFVFYRTLWSLQESFRSPMSLIGKSDDKFEALQQFFKATDSVLKTLAQVPCLPASPSLAANTFCAKYLTSSRLLTTQVCLCLCVLGACIPRGRHTCLTHPVNLCHTRDVHLCVCQIQDPLFRRYFLVQILITAEALQRPNASAPPKPEDPVLPERFLPTLQALVQSTTQLLTKSGPDGQLFTAHLNKLLARERFWVDWKNGNCANFERTPTTLVAQQATTASTSSTSLSSGSTAALEEVALGAPKAKRVLMGNATLSRLWNQAGNFEHLENNKVFTSRCHRIESKLLEPHSDLDSLPTTTCCCYCLLFDQMRRHKHPS